MADDDGAGIALTDAGAEPATSTKNTLANVRVKTVSGTIRSQCVFDGGDSESTSRNKEFKSLHKKVNAKSKPFTSLFGVKKSRTSLVSEAMASVA